jgi:hypothetical protein
VPKKVAIVSSGLNLTLSIHLLSPKPDSGHSALKSRRRPDPEGEGGEYTTHGEPFSI